MSPPPRLRAAFVVVLGVAVIRAACVPVTRWWQDWILILCIFGNLSLLTWKGRAWPYLALAVMGWLFGIYLLNQAGPIIGVYGILP